MVAKDIDKPPLCGRPDFVMTPAYDYRPNWTPLSPITIT